MVVLSFLGGCVDAGTKSKTPLGRHTQGDLAGLRLNEHRRSIDAHMQMEVRPLGIGVEMLITRELTTLHSRCFADSDADTIG